GRTETLESIDQDRGRAKFASQFLARNVPALQAGRVIRPAVAEDGIAVRQVKIAAENRVLLGVGIVVAPQVRVAMPLVRGTKNNVKLVLLGFGFLLGNEIVAPEILDVGAAPAQIIGLGVVREIFLVITAIHDQGDAPLFHVALA